MSDIPREIAPPEESELGPEEEGVIDDVEDAEGTEPEDGGEPAGDDAPEDADPEDGAEPEEPDPVAARRGGGGSQTIRTLRRQRQEAERERDEFKQRLAALETRVQQPAVDPAAAARAEQEWLQSLELMTPAQQAQAVLERGRRELGGYVQSIQFQTNERLDKQAYDSAARTSRTHQQYRTEVERVLADERRQGRNPDRETILRYLVGRDVIDRAQRAAPGQRTAAARRVNGQRAQPTAARGNVPANRRQINEDNIPDEAIAGWMSGR